MKDKDNDERVVANIGAYWFLDKIVLSMSRCPIGPKKER